jgi:hypothetical protein
MGLQPASKVAAILVALAALAARADSLDCPGGIVQSGDSKLDLLSKCGRPSLVEDRAAEKGAFDARNGVARRVVAPVDVWTYDFGKNRFVQLVRIVRGRIASIERGGYGYADEAPWRGRPRKSTCDPAALGEGKLALEILSRCGEPAVKDEWEEEVVAVRQVDGHSVFGDAAYRVVAVWTYDFGPNVLVRYVRVEDGKVTRVETGSYGYGE